MVIMCLFTTFMTCPIIEYIYPPHLRDSGDVKEVASVEGESEDLHAGQDLSRPVNENAKQISLTVIVDKLEHVQGLMNLISCLTALAEESDLSLWAVKLEEPTLTEKVLDYFIVNVFVLP